MPSETSAPWAERLLLALHAALPATLLCMGLVHLMPPPGLAPLALRPAWPTWVSIGLWLGLSALIAKLHRRMGLWQAALRGTAAACVLAGVAGVALRTAQGIAFALALGALAAACLWLAANVGAHRVRAHPRQRGDGPRRTSLRAWRRFGAAWPFWMTAALWLVSFHGAHVLAREPQRGLGMWGMLVAFFLLLPAATLAPWLRRTSVGLAAVAAGLLGWLALRSASALPLGGMLLAMAVAVQAWRRRPARGDAA